MTARGVTAGHAPPLEPAAFPLMVDPAIVTALSDQIAPPWPLVLLPIIVDPYRPTEPL